jgi:hypothetical protein
MNISDLVHNRPETIAVGGYGAVDALDGPTVVRLQAPPQRVGQHALGQSTRELRQLRDEECAHLAGRRESLAIREGSARVHGERPILIAPSADGIVVLEPEAERVHVAMAGCAGGIAAMPLQLLAHRSPLAVGRLLELRHIGRRRSGRHPEDVLEHVLAANHR